MATLLDRLNRELEAFGRRAQEVFDESRARLELMRLRNLRDGAARDLGYLFYQRERESAELEQGRLDAALFKMDDLKHEIDRLQMQLAEEKARKDAEASAARAEAAATAAAEPDATGTAEPPGDAPPAEPIAY
ncbi:MAG TPA: hypothetical protein VFS74_05690 [Gemmatimonadales bacterium]|jgi:hypothetical protein|nr:hypothetical protein [Gemmatimonadales bacterium]